MNENDNLVTNSYWAAPETVRKAVDDFFSKPEDFESLMKKYNVPDEKSAAVLTEVVFTMLGIDPVDKFRTNLIEFAGVTYDQAIKLSADANSLIFKPELVSALNEALSKKGAGSPQGEAAPLRIPDHEQMTRTDGPHLHSQKTMPLSSQTATATFTQAASAQPLPTKSVVDQKLGGMVRSASSIFGFREVKDNTPTQPLKPVEAAKSAPASYNGNDPYREPLI
jgi:hypothetical protein